jgi:ketosteroid isomerase-like protein
MSVDEVIDRLRGAVDAHDLDALTACFAPDYVNETPVHPARGFRGAAQVRRNWEQLFAGIPDLTALVTDRAVSGDTVWTEWEMRGTRRDGTPHLMRGVVVFTVGNDCIEAARFYLEPVETDTGDVDDAVGRLATPGPPS